MKDTFTQH
jgi:hypothetical protein